MSQNLRWTPEQFEEYQKRMNQSKTCPSCRPAPKPVPTQCTSTPMSTDEMRLNKTERAFLVWLRAVAPSYVHIQDITLKLADDCRYTPDFSVNDPARGCRTFYEVKGFWRDDAKVKIKVAARLFPEFRFVVVQKKLGGGWAFSEVKP